jgi:Fe-S cluster biosynthesis and repair protein YggX
MTRMVHCVKFDKEAEGLDRPPLPNELGQRIYENVSKEAWQQWLRQQTILINEYRLSVIDPEAQKFLQQEMEKYFFGAGADLPDAFVPPESS